MIYFDYASTTPMDTESIQVFTTAAQTFFGNANSLHDCGSKAAQLLDLSRQQLATLLHVNKESVIFTSGGSESNVLGIQSLLASKKSEKKQIIISQTEHASLYQYVTKLESEGYHISYLKHLQDGTVDLQHLAASLTDQTCLVIVQHVNSEIGVVQPIQDIKHLLECRDIFLHVDCVQSFAKLPLERISAHCDSLAISSHKVYGPKGVGAVIFPNRQNLLPPLKNVSHEFGFRAGTINVPAIAAFVTSAKKLAAIMDDELTRITFLREALIHELGRIDFQVIQSKHDQLPHILALTFSGLQGQYMMLELNRCGFAVSTGSACQIGKQAPSKTMLAIGKTVEEAHQLVRISFGVNTTKEDVEKLAQSILLIVSQNQAMIK